MGDVSCWDSRSWGDPYASGSAIASLPWFCYTPDPKDSKCWASLNYGSPRITDVKLGWDRNRCLFDTVEIFLINYQYFTSWTLRQPLKYTIINNIAGLARNFNFSGDWSKSSISDIFSIWGVPLSAKWVDF